MLFAPGAATAVGSGWRWPAELGGVSKSKSCGIRVDPRWFSSDAEVVMRRSASTAHAGNAREPRAAHEQATSRLR